MGAVFLAEDTRLERKVASYYLAVGRLDEAAASSRKAIELRPESPVGYSWLAPTDLLRGDAEAARSAFAKYNELAELGEYGTLWSDALVEHTAGNAEASTRAAEAFEKQFGADDPLLCAQIRAWRGDTDAAFAWLEKEWVARDPFMASIKSDPFLKALHADPRWNALLKKIGLPID